MRSPNPNRMLALACFALLPLAIGCSGEGLEPDVEPPDEEEAELRMEDHAEWLPGSEQIALTLWFGEGCGQKVEPLELVSPTELRTSSYVEPEAVACTLARTSYTHELDVPAGTSRTEPVEIFADDRPAIILEPSSD